MMEGSGGQLRVGEMGGERVCTFKATASEERAGEPEEAECMQNTWLDVNVPLLHWGNIPKLLTGQFDLWPLLPGLSVF